MRPRKPNRMKRIDVFVDPESWDAVKRIAETEERTPSSLIRLWMRNFIADRMGHPTDDGIERTRPAA